LMEPIAAPEGPRPVLVYARFLDRDLLDPIAEGLGLADLHVVPGRSRAEAALPLIAPDGADLGAIVWRAPPLGREFIRDIVPALLLAFGLITGFALLALRNARKTALVIEASEARFRDVADASADWIWETDAKARLVFLSERFAEVMALLPQTFLTRPLAELLAARDQDEGVADLRGAMAAREPFRDLLCQVATGIGRNCVLRFAGKPAFDHFGRFLGYRGTASDVTAQIAAERRAHSSR
jgi:PAS domain S-box-containing protein